MCFSSLHLQDILILQLVVSCSEITTHLMMFQRSVRRLTAKEQSLGDLGIREKLFKV